MSMYFYDDTDDWPEYKIIKDDIRHLEKEHLEIRKKIQEFESAVESGSSDAALNAKIYGLKKKMEEIDKKLDGTLSLYR